MSLQRKKKDESKDMPAAFVYLIQELRSSCFIYAQFMRESLYLLGNS